MRRRSKVLLALFGAFLLAVVVSNWTWARLPAAPPPAPGSKYMTVDGVRLHYTETPGRGPGIVLLHGHSGTIDDWNLVVARLGGLRTVAIDRPGYGYSTGGYVPFDRQVVLIRDFANALGMKRPVIAGHSYGGALALSYAERFPAGTSAVVAIDPAIDPTPVSAPERAMAHASNAFGLPVIRTVGHLTFSQLVRTLLADGITPAGFAPAPVAPAYMQKFRAISLRRMDLDTSAAETLGRGNVSQRIDSRLHELRLPVWVLEGHQDQVVAPAAVTRAAEQIHGADFQWLPGGHMQTWLHPTAVAAAIRAASDQRR